MTSLSTHPREGVAWVTGASSGLGQATARQLLEQGWTVMVSGRQAGPLAALVQTFSGRAFAYPVDTTDASAVAQTIERMEREHGPVVLAILAAGVHRPDAQDVDLAALGQVVGTNLMGTAHCLAPLLERMRARRRGQIVVVGSVAGFGPLPTSAAYGASKAALTHLLAARHRDLKREGVLLQLCSPGFIQTPMIAANRFPTPFLLSPDQAAKRLVAGLSHQGFEQVFPWPVAWATKLLCLLPWGPYLWLTDAITRRWRER